MKPLPRIRKTVKWGGAAVSAVLLVVWIGSGWWAVAWANGSGFAFVVNQGHVTIAQLPNGQLGPLQRGWVVARRNPHFTWTPQWQSVPGGWRLEVPLWFLTCVSLVVATTAWRLDLLDSRFDREWRCRKCGYQRVGLPLNVVCPECGAPFGTSPPAAS